MRLAVMVPCLNERATLAGVLVVVAVRSRVQPPGSQDAKGQDAESAGHERDAPQPQLNGQRLFAVDGRPVVFCLGG